MGNLVLDSLEIRNFRGFRHLQIERLGRVNLIVGKNGVGKTALLEALRLYADKGVTDVAWDLLYTRHETASGLAVSPLGREDIALAFKYLFHGRNGYREQTDPVQIGPYNTASRTLSITVESSANGNGQGNDSDSEVTSRKPFLQIRIGDRSVARYYSDSHRTFISDGLREDSPIHSICVSSGGLSPDELSELWDRTTLTDLEDDVIKALRLMTPDVERISFVTDHQDKRTPLRELRTIKDPICPDGRGDVHKPFA